jgi:hypothetical protein
MAPYRLCIFDNDGRLLPPAIVVQADNDAEAIARADVLRGSSAAELLDIEHLRIVKYLGSGDDASQTSA